MDFGEEEEEPVQFTVVGDDKVICAPYLGGGWYECGCVREGVKEGADVREGGRCKEILRCVSVSTRLKVVM